jgi:hypothetical protein
MPLHVWQRRHGPDIIAQAAPIAGFATWQVSTFRLTAPTQMTRIPRAVDLLQTALARADDLARRTFHHTCAADTCGEWLPS